MRRRSVAIVLGAFAASCGLFPDLSDLSPDDASAADVLVESAPDAPTDAPIDAAGDAGDAARDAPSDAACPTITRVQRVSYPDTDTQTSIAVTLSAAQGHLLVALIGAQFVGTLSIADTASTSWTLLSGFDNMSCVTDASPWGSRARIAYAVLGQSVTNDTVTLKTTGSPDYLALTVAEYSTTGALAFTTSSGTSAAASTNTLTTPTMSATGCTNLVVAMLADEDPSGDTWTPLAGFATLFSGNDWSFTTVDDIATPPGAVAAGASHKYTDSCWASAGASFAAH